jgi:hypothetical protein
LLPPDFAQEQGVRFKAMLALVPVRSSKLVGSVTYASAALSVRIDSMAIASGPGLNSKASVET